MPRHALNAKMLPIFPGRYNVNFGDFDLALPSGPD